jgi:cytochrome c553
MKPMASTLNDTDVLNVAAWVSEQKPSPGVAHDPAELALGEKIYRGGIMDRRIPACMGCHSPDGAGIPAQFPRLAGQFPEYVTAQLAGFRDGTRKNNPIMTEVAAKLNDHEIKALADYISGLH